LVKPEPSACEPGPLLIQTRTPRAESAEPTPDPPPPAPAPPVPLLFNGTFKHGFPPVQQPDVVPKCPDSPRPDSQLQLMGIAAPSSPGISGCGQTGVWKKARWGASEAPDERERRPRAMGFLKSWGDLAFDAFERGEAGHPGLFALAIQAVEALGP
ncbi:MAG: hypothetical protein Q9187_003958, partial [Circinaria calcarea]